MSDVFISYSRKDGDFAKRLTNALTKTDRDVWIDWEDIPRASDWLNEIYDGIEKANTFVFIVSQNSLSSEICNYELQHARQHNKRIIPLIRQRISGDNEKWLAGEWYDKSWETIARENWTSIKHLNWIFFDDDANFGEEFTALQTTLEQDLAYIRAHTRLLVRARDWDRGGHNRSLLLVDDEIDNAELWLQNVPDNNPDPTPLHREFITESRRINLELRAEQTRQEHRIRQFRRASVVLGLMVILTIIATFFAALIASDARNQSFAAATSEAQSFILQIEAQNAAWDAQTQQAVAEALGATVQSEATYFSLVQGRQATLAAGSVILPALENTPIPQDYVATLTQIAELNYWEPVIQEFDGVEMVLVPAGCFVMGSLFSQDEQPTHEICFDRPFWIDRYEVTNRQYDELSGVREGESMSTVASRPRANITWFRAHDFCEQRGMRLPTETQWEYAARGPDSLIYPWGNLFIADNVVFHGNAEGTSSVGGRHSGKSWVGSYDMSGNVYEWTSTSYAPYPYIFDDGREDNGEPNLPRVFRGGSFDSIDDLVRAANRDRVSPSFSSEKIGFRCVFLPVRGPDFDTSDPDAVSIDDVCQRDSDLDGTPDCQDLCSTDPNKISPGTCGCGTADSDGDGDGIHDCYDPCPSDPNKTSPGLCGCGVVSCCGDGVCDGEVENTNSCIDCAVPGDGICTPGEYGADCD